LRDETGGATLPPRERMLLTGAGGQVGRELLRLLAGVGEVVAPTRAEMDLSDAASVRRAVRQVRPRWIVNAGAYTTVDKAESEPELAGAVNATAIAVMAEEALKLGAGVVQFSTDYVFDGVKAGPYVEGDATGPASVYGRTKLEGEQALARSGAAHAIFRTSWVYGVAGKNFLLTILRLARDRERLQIVADQHGSPTWSRDLARMTTSFIQGCERLAEGGELRGVMEERGGLYHASGAGHTTWHGFAEAAVRRAREIDPARRFAEVDAITTAEFPTAARRPANSRLSCARLEERLGWRMMDWRDSLAMVMAELGAAPEEM